MAWAIKITGIPEDTGVPIWSVDSVNWWRTDLIDDPRFRKIIDETLYLDYVAILTVAEAIELQECFKASFINNVLSETRHFYDHTFSEIDRVDRLLRNTTIRWVLVKIFEWESGY